MHLRQLHKVLPVKALHARAVQKGQVHAHAARDGAERRAGPGAKQVLPPDGALCRPPRLLHGA